MTDIKDDHELVKEVIRGHVTSFETLVERYQEMIFRMMYRMTRGDSEAAKDLAQTVFVKAFENLGSFSFNHKFYSWIYRISVNEAISWQRRQHPVENLENAALLKQEESQDESAEEIDRALHNEIQLLTPEYRRLIIMKYYAGMSYDEIATAEDLPVGKVKSRLYIAREHLRKNMLEKGFFNND